MKRIALIGSTGSIGRQTCAVVRRYPERFQIAALVANSSAELFLEQVYEFRPAFAALVDEEAGKRIANQIPAGVKFVYGKEGAVEGISYGEIAFIAATGFAGLEYSLKAIELKKDIALANKETLVCGGALVMEGVKQAGIRLLPVDSEHSALWQALHFRSDAPFRRLIITASGGPFYHYTKEQLAGVTPAHALKHPTWNMGAKITIDSATLLNKGFEVIEAKWLYHTELEKIHTVVQPTSIIHSMVEFADGGVLAQMSYPTMELPIQLALTYPDRLPCDLPSLDFEKLAKIEFLPLERKRFPCYDLALSALEKGGSFPCALNGGGEVAVQSFLQGGIAFPQIADTMEWVLDKIERIEPTSYAALGEVDLQARALAKEYIKKVGV